jgi:hypothetical protein
MSSLVKSTILSLGLLAGVAAVAHAQSVSSLPPSGSPAAATGAPVYSSTTKIFPNPGGGSSWQEEHYQAAPGYTADPAQHPYSTSIGPKPGAHSSGAEENYKATDADNAPARHPYTSSMGPRPH